MVTESNFIKDDPLKQSPNDGAGGRTSPTYVDLCELCGGFRPKRVMTPDGPVMLCRRCAYKLGYTERGEHDTNA